MLEYRLAGQVLNLSVKRPLNGQPLQTRLSEPG